jgi:hypothetical protein
MVRMVMVLEGFVKPLAIQAATARASLGLITTSPIGFGGFELSSFVNGKLFLTLCKNSSPLEKGFFVAGFITELILLGGISPAAKLASVKT